MENAAFLPFTGSCSEESMTKEETKSVSKEDLFMHQLKVRMGNYAAFLKARGIGKKKIRYHLYSMKKFELWRFGSKYSDEENLRRSFNSYVNSSPSSMETLKTYVNLQFGIKL